MKLHRFYTKVELPNSGDVVIRDPAVANQLRNVLRKKVGDTVTLFNGDGMERVSKISELTNDTVRFDVERIEKNIVSPNRAVTLYQSMLKKDKIEWVIQKATELGMKKIVPIISDRSEKKGFNLSRAEKIAIEATEQSGRAVVPEIGEPIELSDALQTISGNTIAFHMEGEPIKKFLGENFPISIFIGPEGGWSEEDLKLFSEKNIRTVSLGSATLRGETAALSALSLLLLE